MFCTGPSDVVRFVTSEKSVQTWMHRGVVSCSPETPVEEVAKTMDISERTVRREWAFARAWLYRKLAGDSEGE